MKLRDKLYLVKRSNDKNNKRKILIITFLGLILVITFSVSKTVDNYIVNNIMRQEVYNYFFGTRQSIKETQDEVKNKIKKIEHVSEVFEEYELSLPVKLISIGNIKINGNINLYGKSEEEMKSLSNNKYKNKYSIICHKNMYPSYESEYDWNVNRSELVKFNNYIGSNLYIRNYDAGGDLEKYDATLELVSVLQNDKDLIDENICYVSRDLLAEIHKITYANIPDDPDTINSFYIILDNVKYFSEVIKKVNALNCGMSGEIVSINTRLVNFITMTKYYVLCLVIIFTVIFITKLNKSSIESKKSDYSILKSMGIRDKEYHFILCLENGILLLKSFILLILVIMGIKLMLNTVLFFYPFILQKIRIHIDYVSILVYLVIMVLVLFITTSCYFKKIRKKEIVENLNNYN